jgi:putative oxidoreductase
MSLGLLALRLVIGLLFVGHGTQKLFGWFGGGGRAQTAAMFESLDLQPGGLMAFAAGLSEAGGGLLIALGLLTPLGAAAITAVMVIAIATVHYENGLWVTQKGFEYNLVLIAAVFAIAGTGPGTASLDNALGLGISGLDWALAELAVGIAGAIATVGLGHAIADRQGHGPHASRA